MQNEYKEVIIMLVGGSIIFFVLIGILIFIILFYQKKKFHHANQLLEIDTKHTQTLLISQIEIQEQTFRDISQEIHDNVGQILSLTKLNLNAISSPQEKADQEKLSESIILVSKAIKDLRDLAKSINTDYVEQIGISNAIGQQLNLLKKTSKFETILIENGIPKSLDRKKELIIFRIVQELLNNIVKHANATVIKVEVYYDNYNLQLNVSDNGKGFDINVLKKAAEFSNGLGLLNIQDRINLLKGYLEIHDTSNIGTKISIKVPW
jgi:two-component system NarL family sensor kinase